MTQKHLISWFTGLTLLASSSAWATKVPNIKAPLGNDEKTFVFAGDCPTGEPYRLVSYQKNVAGLTQSFYDYEGPNGKGTVRTESTPKVMAARVCRKMAEIINANYWE